MRGKFQAEISLRKRKNVYILVLMTGVFIFSLQNYVPNPLYVVWPWIALLYGFSLSMFLPHRKREKQLEAEQSPRPETLRDETG